ncbi:TPA: efflux transporter outer membrane subunit [Citrobacter koseri]|uniref:efflux transporter outer membrane subunit n=1 Tax=Citrobacter koseri TaxID=545 RepID=UPI001904E678|nr:efflux transporter outer membrane subunit [Citrobacter koseri]ELJ2666680.1 efflux transporter outer membrane subunit [Citrobacter koseri]MBJ8933598.1 efflux transporter outer membrane subunit [Citrobacter koseri]HAT7563099.1 efflux transporter outer membrane subunit [Citrobacter koseri]HEM7998209.1 efflux transporter outer membrane subunit [Citrobacter koseri]
MTRRPVAALLFALLLSGCQSVDVAPAKPSLQIPAVWRTATGPASATEQVWWRNFHDSHLNRYVDQALQNNSDVLIARERVNEYQARVYAAEGSLFPSLDAGVSGARARTQSAATGLPIYSTLYKGSLTASYDVDIWGVNRSTASAARASLAAQKAAAAAADLTVASSVASGYVTLLALDEQLNVTKSTLKSREEAWNLAKRQYETGYSSRLELMQSDSELRSTRAQIPLLEHQIAQQENALSLLLGSNPTRLARSDRFDALTPLTLPSQLPSSLLNRRPDVVQAERQLIAADATLAASRASLLPSINLTATGSVQDRTLPGLLDDPLRLWSIGGSILAPLLNRQALNAQVDISQSQRNQALYSYEKTVRNAFREVNDSLDAITRYQEQLSELQAQQDVAQETLRIAQNRYRNGYSSYLDVLDAQRTLFSVQTNVVQVKNNLLLAQIDLYKALGGGWSV